MFVFEMMLRNYRLCQAVGQSFQTIPSYKNYKILKTNTIVDSYSEHFLEKVQGFLTFFHLFPSAPAYFIHHIDGGSKVIRFLLAREFEIGEDIGLPLVLIQVGVFLLKGFHKLWVKLVNHF